MSRLWGGWTIWRFRSFLGGAWSPGCHWLVEYTSVRNHCNGRVCVIDRGRCKQLITRQLSLLVRKSSMGHILTIWRGGISEDRFQTIILTCCTGTDMLTLILSIGKAPKILDTTLPVMQPPSSSQQGFPFLLFKWWKAPCRTTLYNLHLTYANVYTATGQVLSRVQPNHHLFIWSMFSLCCVQVIQNKKLRRQHLTTCHISNLCSRFTCCGW